MDIPAYLAEKKQIALNEQQRQGVLSYGRNTLLLAVPGSGKTTVLVSRIAGLMLNHGVPPARILTLTFNKETANDMSRRFQTLFGELIPQAPRFSTIHSFCMRVLRWYADALNRSLPALLEGKEGGEKAGVLREIYRKYTGDFLTEDVYETLERRIGYAKNMLLTREELDGDGFEIEHFAQIFQDYETYKRKNGRMDFDDMLTLTLDIFRRFPEILSRFQGQYAEINVDEAQDTSLVQHRILALLAKNARIFMVGDEDQSIYSFRGAYPRALLEFAGIYPDAEIIKMEENFRSHADLVYASNRFIKQNRQRYAKEMVCGNTAKGSVGQMKLDDYAEQYIRTYEQLAALPKEKTAAVLYRNNESAVPLIDLFYRAELPFYVREHRQTYFSSLAVQDITAYLQLAIDPSDTEAFSKIYYKLGYSKDIYLYAKEHVGDNLFDCIAGLAALKVWQKNRAREYKTTFASLRLQRPAEAIETIKSELNYTSYIEKRMADGSVKTQTYQKLNTAKCLASGLRTIYEFLGKLEAMKQAMAERRLVDPSSNILLSTLHSAKGMEFDQVILLDMVQDVLPSSDTVQEKKRGREDDYENEVRLFYVGVTRAKERLTFYTASRMNGAPAAPSVFLRDFVKGPPPPKEERARPARRKSLPDWKGKSVVHARFDEGRVVEQREGMVTVEFQMFGVKKLDLATCLEKQVLWLKEEER